MKRKIKKLRKQLKTHISRYIQESFFNRDTLALEIGKLLNLPLNEQSNVITINQKLRLLGLLNKSLPDATKKEYNPARFQVFIGTMPPEGKAPPVVVTMSAESGSGQGLALDTSSNGNGSGPDPVVEVGNVSARDDEDEEGVL